MKILKTAINSPTVSARKASVIAGTCPRMFTETPRGGVPALTIAAFIFGALNASAGWSPQLKLELISIDVWKKLSSKCWNHKYKNQPDDETITGQ